LSSRESVVFCKPPNGSRESDESENGAALVVPLLDGGAGRLPDCAAIALELWTIETNKAIEDATQVRGRSMRTVYIYRVKKNM
jgi:hypothetical protein